MRVAWIGPTLASVVLCAGATASASGASGASGLSGVVRKGPITPVCVVERPCTAPAPGVTLLFVRAGHVRARATSGRAGVYRLALAPGTYRVRAIVQKRRRVLKPFVVTVPAGRYARVDFMLDTGIR